MKLHKLIRVNQPGLQIHRHGLLAKISGIQNNVTSVISVIQNKNCETNLDLKDLDVPEQYRSKTEK